MSSAATTACLRISGMSFCSTGMLVSKRRKTPISAPVASKTWVTRDSTLGLGSGSSGAGKGR